MKTAPKCHPGGSQIAPKSLQNGSRRPPEPTPRAETPFLLLLFASWAALGALLGRSWPLLALSWRLLRSPGRSWEPFSSPRGLLWDLFGSLFLTPVEKQENLDFRRQLQRKSRFGRPRGVQNRPQMAPKSLLGASWRLLALSWRLSAAASWRSWGLLGASWAALGAISSSKIKPGYHGTGSAFKARVASIASG